MKQNTTYKQTELGLIPEDWEVKKLGELGFFFKGKGVPKTSIETEGKYKCLTYGDLYTKYDYVIKNVKSFINDASDSQEINFGDICIAGSGETIEDIGKCAVFIDDKTGYAGGDIIIFRSDENPLTLSYILNSDLCKRQKYRLGQGHSVVHIYSSQLQNLKIPLPPLPEQKKIADCLSTWDCAIEKQSALINALTDRKKALMQQLLTGKKRLPGFSGEWKEVKLGSICENFQNGNAFSAKDYKKTGIPIVTMGNINLGGYFYFSESKSNFWIEDKSLERYEIKKGDLIIAMTDVTPEKNLIGLTSIIDIDRIFYLNQRVGHIILKPKLADTDFIFYLSQNSYWRNQCKAFATLGVQANLGTNDIKNINIKLPPIEEQTAIAEILATADRELQLQKEKLAQLQTQKKGLMQVLLTGKKRLLN